MAGIKPPGVPIERGKIHEFANSILDDNPMYHDTDAAKAAGLPGVVAPPTYLSVAAHFTSDDEMFSHLAKLNLDLRFVLHGGQEYEFERPICAGETLTPEMGEVKSYQKEGKRGGVMQFYEIPTLFKDQSGKVVVRATSTIIQTGGVVKE
jgi:acyl dehydratase